MLAWLGDHLFASVLAFFVALGLGIWIGNDGSKSSTAAKEQQQPSLGRVHLDSWPDGVSARTAILASAATRGEAEADLRRARRLPTRGLNLGILRSDDYVGLDPGYWVAFAGQFDTAGEAERTANRYQVLFSTAYQRWIEER